MTAEEQKKAYDRALRQIAECRRKGKQRTELDLSLLDLTTLPPEIGQLTALTELSLYNNQLTMLPSAICQLTALTKLSLHSNQLTTLPPKIDQLTALTELRLDDNQFTTPPPKIGQLTALTVLVLSDNQLTKLPPKIGQLMALTVLGLNNNQLTTLPPEIGQLTALSGLYLGSNRLTTLPPEIGQLTALTRLGLAKNRLATLPPEIGQLTALTGLDLANNRLTTLPPEIGQLTALTELFLHGNPGLAIPDSILGPTQFEVHGDDKKAAARPQDILNFYFAQRQGQAAGTLRAVNEIKVMLVGRGGAGKTSLRRFFMGEPHDKGERETPGIALDSFRLRCGLGELTVRLWDFAGQEITHALHQFFLTEGCVYVLVLDPRSNTEMQDAEYWLGLLRRYAGGAPVLVALNRQDARQGGYDVDRRRLQERFPFLQSFTPTNCEQRETCEELRKRLCNAVVGLKETEPPHLQVPEAWLAVMKDLRGEANGKPASSGNKLLRWLGLAGHETAAVAKQQHLELAEFRKICARHGERDSAKQESLARLLHKLGAVLHFVDEPRLRDTTVLNPHWVTDGVYRLLRAKDRPGSDGVLTLADALAALPGETETTARFLLRLMERFEMCFPLDEEPDGRKATRWLVPGALGEFQPAGVTTADWQKPGSVRLRYVYDPLPEGVLPRFIVMTHLLSEGQPRWRNGVVLVEENAAALVRRGETRNQVEVTAFGPPAARLRLLEIIQGNLERIHADLPEPKPVAEIELAELREVFRPVADLEVAELGKQQVAVDTKAGKVLVQPTLQLNQASEPQSRREGLTPLNLFLSYAHEDKKAKAIFQQNLTVMTMKKLITPWQDGLIEAGMRWREQIQENLGTMEVFVGLLTTAFLASKFIGQVELKAARERLRKEEKDFLFVLVLVDDISLQGLDLAEYQILKPGGKAVCQHASRKAGFDVAQKELEKLLAGRPRRKPPERETLRGREAFRETRAGITVLVQGDYVAGEKLMRDDHSVRIGGDVTNAQVGQTLANCTNTIQQQAPGERRELLERLEQQVRELLAALPAEKQDKAPKIARDLQVLVEQSTSSEPEREWYSLSAKGVLEAATWVKDLSKEIAGTIKNLGTSLWPDFRLPESRK